MSKLVSQKEIARILQLSRMAVSLALRDSSRVSLETRKQVRKLADQLGYYPNPALAALSRYRHEGKATHFRETLAFVTKWREPQGWRQQYVYRFFQGAEARAQQVGYRLEPFWLGEYRNRAAATAVLAARGIRGLLLAPMEQPGSLQLDWFRFATVAIGTTLISPKVHRVMHDYDTSMRRVLEELARRGYRRAALVIVPRVDRITEQRASNVFQAITQRTATFREYRIWFPPKEDQVTFSRWVKKERPECVLSFHEHHMDWLEKDGWRIPEEIGFVNLHIKSEFKPWSGIDYGAMEIGASAVDRIDTLLQRNTLGLPERVTSTLLSGHWLPGKTVQSLKSFRK